MRPEENTCFDIGDRLKYELAPDPKLEYDLSRQGRGQTFWKMTTIGAIGPGFFVRKQTFFVRKLVFFIHRSGPCGKQLVSGRPG